MDERLRFLLYGTYDGFSRSTLGDDNILLVLDNGDKVEIPNHFVKNASDFVEKNQIKLRDVIARIKQLDIGTRKVWLDEFLSELGSDYGTLKYKDGCEQGKVEGLVEREKPVVKQFVADWYEEHKDDLEISIFNYVNNINKEDESAFKRWFVDSTTKPFQILVNMHQFGYEVEKEKRYFVRLKGVVDNLRLLRHNLPTNTWTIGSEEQCFNVSRAHTRKELEEAGFGEVFDSPLFEVEEVE